MARAPQGPRLIKGQWWAVRTVNGKKYSVCLGPDKTKAQRVWPEAYAQLGPAQARLYRPDELITITLPGGAEETHRAMDLLNPKQLTYDPWKQLEEPTADQWEEAFEVARRRHQRRTKRMPSESWEAQIRALRRYLPTGVAPVDLTPNHLRLMMQRMEGHGHTDSSISTRIATLGGVFTALIRSGIHPDLSNPVSKVDYSAPAAKHHRTAGPEDYKLLFNSEMANDPVLLRMIYLGVRIGEAVNGVVDGDTLVIKETPTWRPKNKASSRVLPLPPVLMEKGLAQDVEYKADTYRGRFNKVRGKGSDLVPHSLRHGLVQLTRQQACNPLVIEAVLGHTLPSAMMDIYGGGYRPETMRQELEKVWVVLDSYRTPK